MSALTVAGIQLSVAALSDPGLKRPINEDSFLAEGPAFVVADGMGGYDRGELASAAVVAAFSAALSAAARFSSPTPRHAAVTGIALGHERA